jgi:hypothetical protein
MCEGGRGRSETCEHIVVLFLRKGIHLVECPFLVCRDRFWNRRCEVSFIPSYPRGIVMLL